MSTTSTRNNEHDSKDTKQKNKCENKTKDNIFVVVLLLHTHAILFDLHQFGLRCTQRSSAHSAQFDFPTPKNRHKSFSFRFCLRRTTTGAANGKRSRSTATVQTGDDFSLWPLDSQRSSCTMLHLMRIMKMTLGLLFSLKMHRTKLLCYFISFEMKILRVSCRTFMNLISSSTPSSSSSPLSSS